MLTRTIRTAKACWTRLRDERRDATPLVVLALVLVTAGDEVLIWTVDQIMPAGAAIMHSWGPWATTTLFGVVPALTLLALALVPEWRESWRTTGD